ncbi:Lsr2 family protein [Streptomyces sp. NPDC092296]|uniref:histone-like nucleoid-structuring protein Lsr2 n=1 Tax=Streptomyces sp. NPDC092296 TaxID=3366012 RepID=UPI00380A485B
MAQKVQVLLVDDLDGGEADETVTFALDGVAYEIDLKSENADRLRELLAPFVDKGRKQSGRLSGNRGARARTSAAAGRPAGGSQDTAKIRAWAKDNGYTVNDRGRVPSTVREAYEKAHA